MKYFIGYNYNNVIRSSCIKFPQTTGYFRKFEGDTTMSFKIHDSKLLKTQFFKTQFASKPIYGENNKYIKTTLKIFDGRANTNFQVKKIPRDEIPCKYLSIIMLDSVNKAKKKALSSNTSRRMQI